MSALTRETVTSVHHWNETLFSFTTTRDQVLRFKSGHFVMIGLEVEGKPLLRAYSLVSAPYDDHLEFYSIKVPNGPLTSRLQHIRVGDTILVGKKPTGTLVLNTLQPGKRLYLLATGTGLAPFISIVRDPETYERFEQIVLVHGVRYRSELGYADYLRNELPKHELVGEEAQKQLLYYPTVTREEFEHQGRIPQLLANGTISKDLDIPQFNPETDRAMLCGSPSMLAELTTQLESMGFVEGSSHDPKQFTIERAFVEK